MPCYRVAVRKRRFLMSSAAGCVISAVLAGSGWAQTASHEASGAVQEVVVTAQKQSERLQDVPISVTALSQQQLTSVNATSLLDIVQLVPGLEIMSQTGAPGGSTISIRGITTADTLSDTVATLVDDVPVGSSSSNAFAGTGGLDLLPYDLAGIEILKGPQGTLYGATALGGLVKYDTPTASLRTTTFKIGGELSGVDHGSQLGNAVRASANIPLIDNVLAVNLGAGYVFTPGFINDNFTGQRDFNHGNRESVRIGLLWKPIDKLTVKATSIYQSSDYSGISAVPYSLAGVPTEGYLTADYHYPFATLQDTQVYIVNATYDLGWAALTSVTGYSRLQTSIANDLSNGGYYKSLKIYAPDVYTVGNDKVTEEVRLSSLSSGRLKWTVGLFYTKENSLYYENANDFGYTTLQPVAAYTPFYNQEQPSQYKEVAGFANLTYQITNQLDVSLGGRESGNWQSVRAFGFGFLLGGPLNTPTYQNSGSDFTYSVDTRYHFTPDIMLYGRVATGYRPGGVNTYVSTDTGAAPLYYKPDTTTNYEIGLKSEWLGRRLLLNIDGYYINWDNIHIHEVLADGQSYTGNAASAVSKGIELETSFKVTNDLRIGFNGADTDAKLTSAYPAAGAVSGARLPNTPRLSYNVNGDWTHPLTSGFSAKVTATYVFVGDKISNFPIEHPAGQRLPSYNDINITAGVFNADWDIHAYVTNAGNERAYLTVRNYGATILPPTTAGISVDRTF